MTPSKDALLNQMIVATVAKIAPLHRRAQRHAKRPPTRGYWRTRCFCAACRTRKGAMGVMLTVSAEMAAETYANLHEIAQKYGVLRAASTD